MIEIRQLESNVKFQSRRQSRKQSLQICLDEGMRIDSRAKQFAKADSPRIERVAPVANIKSDSARQPLKQSL
jgi:hypothetical protein